MKDLPSGPPIHLSLTLLHSQPQLLNKAFQILSMTFRNIVQTQKFILSEQRKSQIIPLAQIEFMTYKTCKTNIFAVYVVPHKFFFVFADYMKNLKNVT